MKDILENILHGESPTVEEVMKLTEEYPYFPLPAMTMLRDNQQLLNPEQLNFLRRLVAVNTADSAILATFDTPDNFYPQKNSAVTDTSSAIDTFLRNYGSTSPEEEELLEKMIFNPTPDYSQLLAQEEQHSVPNPNEAPTGSQDDLINAFIVKQKQNEGAIPSSQPAVTTPAERQRSQNPPQPPTDNSLLSLSLAKIFIKQHHYQRAYEIIEHLNLNYPEKSVYFADQLRFLSKLIAIENHKNKK